MAGPSATDDVKTLPLDAWHRAQGARMVPFAGYAMPLQYEGIVAEHEWTRERAGLFDVSHMGQLVVTGEGAEEALEAILPADIAALKPGRVRYSLLLDDNGGIVDDLMVTNWSSDEAGECYGLVVNGATKHGDIAFLAERLPDHITLTHRVDRALLALQGPAAAQALERVLRGVNEDFYFMQARAWEFGMLDLEITRSGYTGEDGYEISVPAEHAETLAGRLCAELEVKPAGLGARDSLRLEAGLPLYGHDLSLDTDPVSAGLSFAISKRRRTEGGFSGADRVLSVLEKGAEKRLVGLELEGRLPAREGALLYAGDEEVGVVTSGGFSPTRGHPIAMGYVLAGHAGEGTALEAQVRNKRLPTRVTKLPFVKQNYHRKGAA
ncbi:glycine cleavage system aminomethyltransferase GcvT [Paraurantiacibacter namhicola]|uniref:aminomethyltransferase n=1 Tax=Paraurantiacibacter namhicola TaxID=645517 RepID=A0A1C7D588_9SPHN|nr:glycine cleavage system aminomethyltransferase GcvT [Paraurantiacibacter namhicola]ANU06646.1 Aminomethyltransferase [Paraurantiacibacter namhicola]